MIIDFDNRNGGGGETTDTTMRASGFTGADFVASSSTLNFNNLSGTTVDTVDLSSLEPDLTNYYTKSETDAAISAATPDMTNYYTKAQTDAAITAYTPTIQVLDPSTGYVSDKVAFDGDNLGYKDTLGTTTNYFPYSTVVKKIVSMSAADYALITPSSDTLYLITS